MIQPFYRAVLILLHCFYLKKNVISHVASCQFNSWLWLGQYKTFTLPLFAIKKRLWFLSKVATSLSITLPPPCLIILVFICIAFLLLKMQQDKHFFVEFGEKFTENLVDDLDTFCQMLDMTLCIIKQQWLPRNSRFRISFPVFLLSSKLTWILLLFLTRWIVDALC